MLVTYQTIQFRIDIDFPDANVDVVYDEARASGVNTPASLGAMLAELEHGPAPRAIPNSDTPTANSVDTALAVLDGTFNPVTKELQDSRYFDIKLCKIAETELEKLGAKVVSTYGLMMGTCHLIVECDLKDFNDLYLRKCLTIVWKTFEKYVVYYKEKPDGEEKKVSRN